MSIGSRLRGLRAAYFLLLTGVATSYAQTSELREPAGIGTGRWFLRVLPTEMPSVGTTPEAQIYGQLLPAVGRDDLWASYPHRALRTSACDVVSQVAGSIQDVVADLARNTQIVIVNEAHDIPWHRNFTESLLGPLWDQGYRYLAAETFFEPIDGYREEHFGRVNIGYYASEPAFGALIRTAKQLGYELVPYEADPPPEGFSGSRSERVALREEGQANHLMERVFATNPDAKVIVHAGYSHAAEIPIPFDGSTMLWMAARLKEKSGIDPLTIDQTYCRSEGTSLQLASPSSQMPTGTFDLAIAYPEVVTRQGRATWRLLPGMRFVHPPEGSVPTVGRAIVEARYEDEPDEAIPVDRLLLQAGESIPLVLPPGEFRLTVVSDESDDVKQFHIGVE
jgi:hypothetical protein